MRCWVSYILFRNHLLICVKLFILLFRWATQQREAVHHKEMPRVDHMGILRQLQPAKEIAAIIENLNNQLYEDVKYFNVKDYPKVEVLV